jgi:hypothetical protein
MPEKGDAAWRNREWMRRVFSRKKAQEDAKKGKKNFWFLSLNHQLSTLQ